MANPDWTKGKSANPARMWKPGQSGNLKGRPITKQYHRLLKKKLSALKIDLNRDTIAVAFAKAGLIQAIQKGNIAFAREITDRVEGPPVIRSFQSPDGQEQLEISAKLGGSGDLVAAISTIYGIRIYDQRDNKVIEVTPDADCAESGSEAGAGTAEESSATLSLPETVDRGPEPSEDSE
jgi:hypothetical protein